MSDFIHAATIKEEGKEKMLFLKKAQGGVGWFDDQGPVSEEFDSLPKALEYAWKQWKEHHFSLMPCGYKFTLPERDEHGTPALFEEMAKSLNSMSGVFFDEREGLNCIVYQIPTTTRRFFEQLKTK